MDFTQYNEIFVAEGKELLQSLNTSILTLEQHPTDLPTIDEIFRCAHSFKGASSTMGFEKVAALTHEMEQLLDAVRAGTVAADADVVETLFACIDSLEQAVDEIATSGTEGDLPVALIERVRSQMEAASTPQLHTQHPELVRKPPRELFGMDADVTEVRLRITADEDARSIRAYMAFSAIESHVEVVWSSVAAEDLDEFMGTDLVCIVAAESQSCAAGLQQQLERIPEVVVDSITEYRGEQESPETVPSVSLAVSSVDDQESPSTAPSSSGKQKLSGTVRIDAARLDTLMHLMGEVVVHRGTVEARLRDNDVSGAITATQELRRATRLLQAEVMNVRMVPVESALMRMPRLVRDLSTKLGKEVDLQIVGADTEIDRSVVDALADPIVHLIRNALDHGIELPEDREAAGKPRCASLTISAAHAGGNVVISVQDDGRGINPQTVTAIALERGIITAEEADMLSEKDATELIFRAGFSTAQVATDVSGRGVGMDAVRAMCREWGGDVSIDSTTGRGSTASIRIPLTLAVMSVLVVEAGASRVAIPIDRIERTVRLADYPRAEISSDVSMVSLDDGIVGEIHLGVNVGYGSGDGTEYGVIVSTAQGRRVLAVGRLVGEFEVVTKPMPAVLHDQTNFMGAAVQGDGSVVLIVDCDRVVAAEGAAPDRTTSIQMNERIELHG